MKTPSSKTTPTRICKIGCTTKRIICECGRPTVLKATREGLVKASATKNKTRSRGYDRDGVKGFKQAHNTFGDCESAVKI